jgi:hypothetical protein
VTAGDEFLQISGDADDGPIGDVDEEAVVDHASQRLDRIRQSRGLLDWPVYDF